MGFEYKFKVTREELERDPTRRGQDVVNKLLSELPGFRSKDGDTYYYSSPDAETKDWDASIVALSDGVMLCIYQRGSWGKDLMIALMFSLLDWCGRVEVEDG